ncbi:MAG TPA: AAA family ATPase, partial [Gammaproteobacteria bacterium]|nr:AAA family ATPase [Gammaproteobacteria bacterium]
MLAYLAATGRGHTRAHLCSLLWESTDDPRGALRWSLSKLRPVVNDEVQRLEADRDRVSFLPVAARIDSRELNDAVARGVQSVSTEELQRLAILVRGEFLEGFELSELYEFQGWCVAMREQAREQRCMVLGELVRRLKESPRQALPYARALVQADNLSVGGRRSLLELLLRADKQEEARQQFEIARRLFRELDVPGLSDLIAAWTAMVDDIKQGNEALNLAGPAPSVQVEPNPPVQDPTPATGALIGRQRELARLQHALDQSRNERTLTITLVSGEPGIGKSHLVGALADYAAAAGSSVLRGRSYEAETTCPFGPWVDALGVDVARRAPDRDMQSAASSREEFFQTVAETTSSHAQSAGGALLILDDIQWLDPDSAELLHFVVRGSASRPLSVVLIARSGELEDNEAAMRTLRGLRRETRVEKIELKPLSREETAELVASVGNVDAIYEASAGNPLFALELTRAASEGTVTPASLALLVRERVARLPAAAAEVLRWGAVLGHVFDVSRLESISSLEPNELIDALERLEHHALLRSEESAAGVRYVFAHDVVREVVYGELSQPRRRLMHRQVAKLLAPELPDPLAAAEVARHASLAGEALLGVRACVSAGLDALRAFANADAEALARRGLELVDDLEEAERIAASLDLLHIQYSARSPDREQAAVRVQALAERALDLGLTRPARLGFQMLSFLRWESSSLADAHANILQAERVSRLAEPEERATALANAARCFVLLERNMEQAEAFVMEAELLTRRGARATSVVPFATAMLHAHRGETDEAINGFREARWLGREQGDRLAEFRAVEQWTMVEIDRGRYDEALT